MECVAHATLTTLRHVYGYTPVTEQVTEIDFQNMKYRPKKLAEKTNKSLVKNEVELELVPKSENQFTGTTRSVTTVETCSSIHF